MKFIAPPRTNRKRFEAFEGAAEFRRALRSIHRIGGRQVGREAELVDRYDAAELINRICRSEPASAEVHLTPISGLLGGVLKEVLRRCELRQQLEAECGPIGDDAFLEVCNRSGVRI